MCACRGSASASNSTDMSLYIVNVNQMNVLQSVVKHGQRCFSDHMTNIHSSLWRSDTQSTSIRSYSYNMLHSKSLF
jgi:hypothetical protein